MTSVPVAASSKPITWADLKGKRTEALPKHTLFGSNLEILKEEDKTALKELDLEKYQAEIDKERKLRQERYKVKLPPHLKGQLPDGCLAYSKDELLNQMKKTRKAKELMDFIEQKARYFSVGTTKNKEDTYSANPTMHGYTDHQNSSRCKTQIPVHKTNVYNTQRPTKYSAPPTGQSYCRFERKGPPDRMPKEFYMKPPNDDETDQCALKLPPNIKHQFGTKVCNQVLSDPNKVQSALDHLKEREPPSNLRSSAQKRAVLDDKIDPSYASLGHALRLDFFPGHTYNHKKSVAAGDYTEDVHHRRVADPDQWRCQRDQLSTWAEQNVLRERMKKAWDTYLTETLSASKK